MNQTEDKKPTYLYLLQHGVEKELPSGLVVRLRPVDVGMMLTSKRIPDSLMTIVKRQIYGIQQGMDEDEVRQQIASETEGQVQQMTPEQSLNLYSDLRAYGEAVALNAIISPRIVEHFDGAEDEIELSMLPTDDLIALGRIVGVPLKELENFRFEPSGSLEPVPSGENDGTDAESGDGAGDISDQPLELVGVSGGEMVDPLPVRRRRDPVRDVGGEQT